VGPAGFGSGDAQELEGALRDLIAAMPPLPAARNGALAAYRTHAWTCTIVRLVHDTADRDDDDRARLLTFRGHGVEVEVTVHVTGDTDRCDLEVTVQPVRPRSAAVVAPDTRVDLEPCSDGAFRAFRVQRRPSTIVVFVRGVRRCYRTEWTAL
jgi:hypothetical protein